MPSGNGAQEAAGNTTCFGHGAVKGKRRYGNRPA